jgi:hypothetical protein
VLRSNWCSISSNSARLVVNAEGEEVLDLGRRTRTISRALRRAIVLRDQHCQFPGCRVPAAWCDVHHLVHWLLGATPTSTIARCRVGGTTSPCTKAAGSSNAVANGFILAA